MSGRLPWSDGERNESLRLYRALGEVVAELGESRGIVDACVRLADFGVRYFQADIAGVFRHPRRGGADLVAGTDVLVAQLATLRSRFPDLPGGAPVAEGEILTVADAAHPEAAAWHAITTLGLRSALIIGLPELSHGPATIALYSHRPDAFASATSEFAALIRLGGFALRDVERRANLEDALHTRDVIGQAQGVLMERYRLTSEQAMGYLRRRSQQSHRPIRDLATEVVQQREAASQAAGLADDSA